MQFSRFVVRLGHEWALDRHRDCRNAVEDSDAFPELSVGLSWRNEEAGKQAKRRFLGWNGASGMEAAALVQRRIKFTSRLE